MFEMSNKKIENIMLVIVFLIAIILSFYYKKKKTKSVTENEYKSSLESVTILDNQLILEDYKRTYNAIVDCSKFEKDQNIIDYKLKESNDVIVRYAFYYISKGLVIFRIQAFFNPSANQIRKYSSEIVMSLIRQKAS